MRRCAPLLAIVALSGVAEAADGRSPRPVVAAAARSDRAGPAVPARDLGSLVRSDRFSVADAPGWVEAAEPRLDAPVPKDDTGGAYLLLSDHQVRVQDTVESYRRIATKLLSPAGVQDGSEVRFHFEPTYQTLTIHFVRLWRDGKAIDALVPADVRVVQQETDLSQQIYNGTLTALLFVKDVRPGDVLDYAATVTGRNPVFGGRFAQAWELGASLATHRLRHRLLWPAARPLKTKTFGTALEPAVSEAGGVKTFVWERTDVAASVHEDTVPVWYDATPFVQLSEFESWGDVAIWASALFESKVDAAPLKDLLDGFRQQAKTVDERALLAIRFAQDEVRYLGIEIGPNTHQPHPPAEVLAQRFGDCKDKALLLVTLLRGLGVEAVPALVNTRARTTIDGWLPSPGAFDHAILVATLGGKKVWIDATNAQQGGRAAELPPPPFARALLVTPDTTALSPIPEEPLPAPNVVSQKRYTVAADGSVGLVVTSTFTGSKADDTRGSLAGISRAELAKRFLNSQAEGHPGIEAVAPPRVEDDREKNVVVLTETYKLRDFWKDGQHELWARALQRSLHRPGITVRTLPLGVHHPTHIRQDIVFTSKRAHRAPADLTIDTSTFFFRRESRRQGDTLTLSFTYRSKRDAVPPSEIDAHLRDRERAYDAIGHWISREGSETAVAGAETERIFQALLGVAVLALVVLAGRKVVRRRSERPVLEAIRFRPGEAPASAIELSGTDEVAAKLRELRCTCGARIGADGTREGLTFNERALVLVTRTCQWCSTVQSVYFDVGAKAS